MGHSRIPRPARSSGWALAGLKVVGEDVVENASAYGNSGDTMAVAAAEFVQSLMYLMLKAPLMQGS